MRSPADKCVRVIAWMRVGAGVTQLRSRVRRSWRDSVNMAAFAIALLTISAFPRLGGAQGPERFGEQRALQFNEAVEELYRQGRYSEARAMGADALTFAELLFGPNHRYTGTAVNNLAVVYESTGEYGKALPLSRRALAIAEESEGLEHPTTGLRLNNLAQLYRAMGEYERALPLYERALLIAETAGRSEHRATGALLHNFSELYRATGAYEKALRLSQRALAISRKLDGAEHASTGNKLSNVAELYRAMGAYDRALPEYLQALAIAEKAEGRAHPSTGNKLTNLAHLYRVMGAYDKALPLFERALAIARESFGDKHRSTAIGLNNVALLYRHLHAYPKALPLSERALAITQEVEGPGHPSTGIMLDHLASLHQSMGAYEKALPMFEQALAIAEKSEGPDHPSTVISLNNLATLHRTMAAYEAALPLYHRALAIALARSRLGFDPDLLGHVAEQLCILKRAQGGSSEAIFYCKLAVNARQQQRTGARGLDKELRDSLTERVNSAYYALAALLADAGRLAEAEEVLLALKDSEYIEFIRGAAADSIPLTNEEKRLADEVNAIAEELAKVYAELESHRRQILVIPPEKLALQQERRNALQQQLIAKFDEISSHWNKQPALKEEKSKIDPRNTQLAQLTARLAESTYGESSVVVMYVLEERRTTVFVTDRNGPALLTLPVGSGTINPLIDTMRLAIREKRVYRQSANALYRHLVAPVETHLSKRQSAPGTLMLYLTDRLRYLPFATLVDDAGRHLIEKYRLAVFTAAAREKVSNSPTPQWTVTAFGSTRPSPSDMLTPLPAVKDELATIVRTDVNPNGLLRGQGFLDEKFTREAWQRMLEADSGTRHSVVHVASHFKAQPGNWNQSFLLLGTGERYTLSELDQAVSLNLDDLDLLTLSACATELTDQAQGNEFEGLGALFQKKGARSVIGTLWPIQDAGSAAWMAAFYSARGEQRRMSKAEAVQSAQLKLLRGEVKSSNTGVDLSHPYYWAPFILMGNWL